MDNTRVHPRNYGLRHDPGEPLDAGTRIEPWEAFAIAVAVLAVVAIAVAVAL